MRSRIVALVTVLLCGIAVRTDSNLNLCDRPIGLA